MNHPYHPEKYQPELLATWIQIAERQAAKDRILIPRIAKLLGPGPVLELGSGTGHIAQMLIDLGYEVTGSDFAEFFVEHMRQKGIPAMRIDATDIRASHPDPLFNLFCQSISPFITSDRSVIARTYRSAFEALAPSGRLVLIHAMAERPALADTMRIHRELCAQSGFKHVRVRRDQLLPSSAYRSVPLVAAAAEALLAAHWGSRFVLSASK